MDGGTTGKNVRDIHDWHEKILLEIRDTEEKI